MQLLILTLLVAAASATYSYGSYGSPYYSNYGGYGGSLYGPSYGSYGGAVSYDLGGYGAGYSTGYGSGYGTGYGSSYAYQPARFYPYRNAFGGFSFPSGPAQISFVMGSAALQKNSGGKTTQKTINTSDFSTKQSSVQTDKDDSSEDVNYDDNFFGNEENFDDLESVFEDKPTTDRTSQQPSKTDAPKNKGHSSSHATSSHDSSTHDSKRTKTPISHEPAVISSDHQQSKKQSSAKSSTSKGYFPSFPSLYSPVSNSPDDSSFSSRSSSKPSAESTSFSEESKIDREDKSPNPERYTDDMTYSTLKGQKNTAPSNTFVQVPEHGSKDFDRAVGSNDQQFPNQQLVAEQQQTNSKSPVYNFPPRQTRHKSSSYEQLIPVIPVLTPESPIIYDQGFDIPVEYVI